MKANTVGLWTKGTGLTIRMIEAVRAAVAAVAVEDKRAMAEVVSEVLTGWAIKRDTLQSGNPK